MDGHILRADVRGTPIEAGTALSIGHEIVDRVRSAEGMLATNWHQEVAFNRLHVSGYMETLERLVGSLIGSEEVWLATPREVCAHWRELSARVVGEAN